MPTGIINHLTPYLMLGGVLGIYCHHDYAHAAKDTNKRFPGVLKGIDAAILAACNFLKLKTLIRPVYLVKKREWKYYVDEEVRNDALTLFGVHDHNTDREVTNVKTFIGKQFMAPAAQDDLGYYEEDLVPRLRESGHLVKEYQGIEWINSPAHKIGNIAYLTVSSILCD
jgi:hypothetical protein